MSNSLDKLDSLEKCKLTIDTYCNGKPLFICSVYIYGQHTLAYTNMYMYMNLKQHEN